MLREFLWIDRRKAGTFLERGLFEGRDDDEIDLFQEEIIRRRVVRGGEFQNLRPRAAYLAHKGLGRSRQPIEKYVTRGHYLYNIYHVTSWTLSDIIKNEG